jgi:GntR family transcriptional regulator, transcriptional repressor for pyruvate dehydrogenase complex
MGDNFAQEIPGVATSRTYQEATARIKDLIRSRQYGPGDRLPSERDLAETLGISRSVVREALRSLVGMGILATRQGSGTVVAMTGEDLLTEPVEFLLLLDRFNFADLIEAREAIEMYLAERAAVRHTKQEGEEIEAAYRAMQESDMTTPEGGAAHRRFHNAIAQAAHSPLLERLLSSLLQKRSAYVQSLNLPRPDWVVRHDDHSALVEAIRQRDAGAARQAMQREMERARESWEDLKALSEAKGTPLPPVEGPVSSSL